MNLYSYPVRNGVVLKSRMKINLLQSVSVPIVGQAFIHPGTHARSSVYAGLDVGSAIYLIYAPICEGILFFPEVP
jgi:hypothetical protein